MTERRCEFRAYLRELVVSPASRGRGVGASLVSEHERRLVDRRCAVLIADNRGE